MLAQSKEILAMKQCPACGSVEYTFQQYDHHPIAWTRHGIAAVVLPPLDTLLPRWTGRIKRFAHARRNSPFRGNVRVCRRCGHGVLMSPPSAEKTKSYYQTTYWQQRSRIQNDQREPQFRSDPRALSQLAFVREHLASPRCVLEIGAGPAYASLLLRDQLKPEPLQIDVCEPGVEWTQHYENHQINRVADFFPFQPQHRYDYIHTSHWLEHIDDMHAGLDALVTCMNPGGLLFVEVPNTGPTYWSLPGYDSPHIHFFTSMSLRELLTRSGFVCLALGEFGITRHEQQQGIKCTPERYGPQAGGIWIRSLFSYPSQQNKD
jgi:2-polyprenyl-3-methyl-5-hydroxy-6-metoxy-1,4-benzoquinol methylase